MQPEGVEVVRRPLGGLTRSQVTAVALAEQALQPPRDVVINLPKLDGGVARAKVPAPAAQHGVELFVARLSTTTIPSDSRCAALDFAGGLYEPRCPDLGCADGSLVFRSAPCPRAALRTPPSSRTRASPDWGARDIVFAAT